MGQKSTLIHVIGTETENRVHDSTAKVNHTVVVQEMQTRPRPYGAWSVGGHRGTNGARAYQDVGDVLEYAAPECTNGTDAMYYELAGIMFWSRYARICDRALGRAAQAWIMKSNTSSQGASSAGYHINISMPMASDTFEVNFAATVNQLKAFVATLQLISGAGVVLPSEQAVTRLGTPAYGYAISSRAIHVVCDASKKAWSKPGDYVAKPLFLERNEPLADENRFWRLQICGLDSNILPAAIQLKLDILLIMAEMVAIGAINPIKLIEDKSLGQHTACRVSLDWRTPLETDGHGTLTPLEIQWYYFHEAEEYVIKYRDGRGADILQQWADILIAFDTDEDVPAALNGKVDWVTKALMLTRNEAKADQPFTYLAAENLHFNYHAYRINASGLCLPILLAQRYGAPDLTRRVVRAMRTPPSDTRAWARGTFIAAKPLTPAVEWDRIQALNSPVFGLPDPSLPTSPEFEKFMEGLTRAS